MIITSFVIGIISIVVSLTTLFLKLYSDLYKVDIYFSTYHNEHSICIANRTNKPLLVFYYELYWNKQIRGNIIELDNYDMQPLKIEPYGYEVIAFNEQNHFSLKRNGKLYIKLTITGNKKRKKLLHSNRRAVAIQN